MSTSHADIFAALCADFQPGEVKWRKQGGKDRAEKQVPYITARTVMNRLDDVVGCQNWWDEYTPGKDSVVCKLSIRLPDGRTVTKQDAGGAAEMKDEGDGEKAAFSDAFKRAAVKFGVGRLLYGDGVPSYSVPDQVEAPSTPAPAAIRDERTCWQLVSDAVGKANDRVRVALKDPDLPNVTDARTASGRLLWLAWNQGKTTVEPKPEMSPKDLAHHLDEVYANHRTWLRGQLRDFLARVESDSTSKATTTTEVPA